MLSVVEKLKLFCMYKISSKGILNIFLVVVARLRRMSENLVRSADRSESIIRAKLKKVVKVVLINVLELDNSISCELLCLIKSLTLLMYILNICW